MDGASPYVYIVEDDEGFRNSFRVLLDSCGFKTIVFRSGRDFLAVAFALDEGCIVLDVDMPEMNGVELFRRLRAGANAMPVILLTASPIEPIARALGGASRYRILEKGIDANSIVAAIEFSLKS